MPVCSHGRQVMHGYPAERRRADQQIALLIGREQVNSPIVVTAKAARGSYRACTAGCENICSTIGTSAAVKRLASGAERCDHSGCW